MVSEPEQSNQPGGRPAIVAFRLTREEKRLLERACRRANLNVSGLLRKRIAKLLLKERGAKE